MLSSRNCRPALRTRAPLVAALLCAAALCSAPPVRADAQRDPELRAIVAAAIATAECFPDKYDSAVWFALMEPRLRKTVKDHAERVQILQTAYCEAHRPGEQRLPPGLVLAVIDVESRFNRWAVSSAGAVGLMQVMAFWPAQLGMERHQLTQVEANMRMGCAILRHYLKRENNDVHKALARYNGSIGRRTYSDKVVQRWTSRWNGADDLGLTAQR
jgi:soluble lytic murein transglycosylase-like protein